MDTIDSHTVVNYNAIKAITKFLEYNRKLKLKDSALELFKEIINDIRKTNSKDRLKEIEILQTELLEEKERLKSIDTKYADGELSSEDFQRMKSNIAIRRDKTNTILESLNLQNTSIGQKLEHAFNVIRNILEILSSGRVEHKI